jgi:hypothetical protein
VRRYRDVAVVWTRALVTGDVCEINAFWGTVIRKKYTTVKKCPKSSRIARGRMLVNGERIRDTKEGKQH